MKKTAITVVLLFVCCGAYSGVWLLPVKEGLVFYAVNDDVFMKLGGSQVAICESLDKEPYLCKVVNLQEYIGEQYRLDCQRTKVTCVQKMVLFLKESHNIDSDYLVYSSFEARILGKKFFSLYEWIVITIDAPLRKLLGFNRHFFKPPCEWLFIIVLELQ